MKKIIILSFAIISVLNLFSQAPYYGWASASAGNNNDDSRVVTSDAAGNVYVIGDFTSTTFTVGSTALTNLGGIDIFVAKYNSSGQVLWAKSIGGTSNESGRGIALDANGNVYITGYFFSPSITVGPNTLNNTASGTSDIFIAKLDSSGNALWAKSIGGTDQDYAQRITTDATGNVYLTGNYYSSSIAFGSATLTQSGGGDMFIAKYDSSGNALWAKSAVGAGYDLGFCIATDPSGNVVVGGAFTSDSLTFGTVTLTNTATMQEIFVVKYAGDGTVLWAVQSVDSGTVNAWDICADASGNFYLAGSSRAAISFGSVHLPNAGNYDMIVVKYNSAGTVQWARSAGGSADEEARSISVDHKNNIWVTGVFGSSSIMLGSNQLNNAGGSNIFLMAYDSLANVLWAQAAGGPGYDNAYSITAKTNGRVYFAGKFLGDSLILGNTVLSDSGFYDFFVCQLIVPDPTGINDINDQQTNEKLWCYPNPFDQNININFEVSMKGTVTLRLLDIYGNEAIRIVQNKDAGSYHATFNTAGLATGIYFCELKTQAQTVTKKLILAR
jgi:hypothetical protein